MISFYRIKARCWACDEWHLQREVDTEAQAREVVEELRNRRIKLSWRSAASDPVPEFGGVRVWRVELIDDLNLDDSPERVQW